MEIKEVLGGEDPMVVHVRVDSSAANLTTVNAHHMTLWGPE